MNHIDADSLIDQNPWSDYQKFLTALAAVAIILDGFDIQVLAFAVPTLVKEWNVARSAFAPVLALGLAGMVAGGPVFGYWGDRYGRRSALIAAVAVFGFATAATAFIHSVLALAVLRFVTGMGAGGALPNASALAAEFAPLRRRPVAVKLTIVCVPLGGMLGGVIASLVLPSLGWRALYLIGGLAPLVYALLLFWLLPESPRFLIQNPAGWPALAAFLGRAGISAPLDSSFKDRSEGSAAPNVSLQTLWTRVHVRQTAGLWIAFFFCLSAIYLVFGWLPTLLSSQGLSSALASGGLAFYNFGGVAGVLIWAMLTTQFGSRQPLILGSLGAAITAVAVFRAPPGLLLPALALNGLLANALQTSMYALAAHVYPTSIRSSGVAWCGATGRLGGLLSSLFGALLISAGAGFYWGSMTLALLLSGGGLALVSRHIPPSRYRNPS